MAGTGRPGGNPDLEKYQFKRPEGRSESMSEILNLRVTKTMKERLMSQSNWQSFVRDAIAKALENES
jgi:hypothetical protein